MPNMAAGPLSVSSNASATNDGILIGDKVYSEVYLTIDNSLIPEERLSPTPSMLDGLDLNTETDLRILGCELIQSAGILLRLPQVTPFEVFNCVLSMAVYLEVLDLTYLGLISSFPMLARWSQNGGGSLFEVRPLYVRECVLNNLCSVWQVAMATGQVLFHRFFYSKSFVKHSFEVSLFKCAGVSCRWWQHNVWMTFGPGSHIASELLYCFQMKSYWPSLVYLSIWTRHNFCLEQ